MCFQVPPDAEGDEDWPMDGVERWMRKSDQTKENDKCD